MGVRHRAGGGGGRGRYRDEGEAREGDFAGDLRHHPPITASVTFLPLLEEACRSTSSCTPMRRATCRGREESREVHREQRQLVKLRSFSTSVHKVEGLGRTKPPRTDGRERVASRSSRIGDVSDGGGTSERNFGGACPRRVSYERTMNRREHCIQRIGVELETDEESSGLQTRRIVTRDPEGSDSIRTCGT